MGRLATDETLNKVVDAIKNSETVQAQKEEIQAEGVRVLATIPQDYKDTVEDVSSLKEDLGDLKDKGVTPEMTSFVSDKQIIYSQNHDYWESKTPLVNNATTAWHANGNLYYGDGGNRYLFGMKVMPNATYKISQFKANTGIVCPVIATLVFASDDKIKYGKDVGGTYVQVSIVGDRQYSVSQFTAVDGCNYVWFVINKTSYESIINSGYTLSIQKITNEHTEPTYPVDDDIIIPYKLTKDIKIHKESIIQEAPEIAIIAWGDSLTMGAGAGYGSEYDTYSYPAVLSNLIGKEVKNYGVGGETIETIMGRQGCYPMIVAPCSIPNSGRVEVSISSASGSSISPLLQVENFEKGVNPCTLSGVKGILSHDPDSNKYYFTRDADGDAVKISRPAILYTYAMTAYKDKDQILLFWVGQNNSNEYSNNAEPLATKIINSIRAAIEYSDTQKYIVIASPINGVISIYDALYKRLKISFAVHLIDCANYLIDYGLADENITPTEQDEADISDRKIPTSLKGDNLHLNRYGYDVVARLVKEKGIELGYWN